MRVLGQTGGRKLLLAADPSGMVRKCLGRVVLTDPTPAGEVAERPIAPLC